ncbi:hypothetical protein UR09_04330 [Candidatus Nitromaritima sp. SCGC AAA799-A02]|nr:hypothetical protein UR09_04330 [Candidatus Nitromaritima sp. SCGC AAA799-A02]KMP11591.1 hypothetical protein UZ36_03845 [Candidatus Nitromaritima sp. SCGC AAA799-C22]
MDLDAIYEISLKTLEGRPVGLSEYRGKVLFIVNVASRCGFTPQYKGLQALHEKYASKGLCILGFPCNDFGGQEPGSEKEIRDFCEINYGVGFELFEKVKVKGEGAHPLYRVLQGSGLPAVLSAGVKSKLFQVFTFLMSLLKTGKPPVRTEVQWNFHKFLIDKEGVPVAHFASDCEPRNPGVIDAIERELSK